MTSRNQTVINEKQAVILRMAGIPHDLTVAENDAIQNPILSKQDRLMKAKGERS